MHDVGSEPPNVPEGPANAPEPAPDVPRNSDRWLSTAAAAERLAVKPATLYAYVSRGLIDSHRLPGHRGSAFLRHDVERLLQRGRASGATERDVVVHSAITDLREDGLTYRGREVADLAGAERFEAVANLLWSAGTDAPAPWGPSDVAVRAAIRAQESLPRSSSPLDRLRLITAVASTTDALRGDLRPDAVRGLARRLLSTLVAALPSSVAATPRGAASEAPKPAASAASAAGRIWLAERLAHRLSPSPPTPPLVSAMDSALVLLADHELAASTLAARVAASARCDPYAVIECGLAAVGGSLHGAAAGAVERLLDGTDADVTLARVAHHLRERDTLPGFGHFAYPGGDPRATALLDLLGRTPSIVDRLAAARAVMATAADHGLPPPNIDFALATFTTSAGMAPGSAEAIFAVARCAGWIAHALEQYEGGDLIRPRAVYVGP